MLKLGRFIYDLSSQGNQTTVHTCTAYYIKWNETFDTLQPSVSECLMLSRYAVLYKVFEKLPHALYTSSGLRYLIARSAHAQGLALPVT